MRKWSSDAFHPSRSRTVVLPSRIMGMRIHFFFCQVQTVSLGIANSSAFSLPESASVTGASKMLTAPTLIFFNIAFSSRDNKPLQLSSFWFLGLHPYSEIIFSKCLEVVYAHRPYRNVCDRAGKTKDFFVTYFSATMSAEYFNFYSTQSRSQHAPYLETYPQDILYQNYMLLLVELSL